MINKTLQNVFCRALYLFARSAYLNLRSAVVFPYGYVYFKLTGKTPQLAYQSMIWLFCATQGRFNDWVSGLISKKNPPVSLVNRDGVLGDMSEVRLLSNVVSELQHKGFVVFPSALPVDVVQRLRSFTESTPALIRRMDGQNTSLYVGKEIYTGGEPAAVRYDYDPNDLLNHEDVQALLADGSLLSVVQKYLDCKPIADVLSMWWHTNFSDSPDATAAQYFHFDMDRLKWVKIFIYLTDVGPDNGPHAFVEGSHATGAIPSDLLKKGYVRITDEEIAERFSAEKIHSFTAPMGSIIIEDTRGFHKGVHVVGDGRLILQLQFSNSLFGTNYPTARMRDVCSPSMKLMLDEAPTIYRQYC